jgi:hypothetical protein
MTRNTPPVKNASSTQTMRTIVGSTFIHTPSPAATPPMTLSVGWR